MSSSREIHEKKIRKHEIKKLVGHDTFPPPSPTRKPLKSAKCTKRGTGVEGREIFSDSGVRSVPRWGYLDYLINKYVLDLGEILEIVEVFQDMIQTLLKTRS